MKKKYFNQIFDNTCMMNMGNKMDCAANFIASSDQIWISRWFRQKLCCKFVSHHNIWIQFNDFSIANEKSTRPILAYIYMHANFVLWWKTRLIALVAQKSLSVGSLWTRVSSVNLPYYLLSITWLKFQIF